MPEGPAHSAGNSNFRLLSVMDAGHLLLESGSTLSTCCHHHDSRVAIPPPPPPPPPPMNAASTTEVAGEPSPSPLRQARLALQAGMEGRQASMLVELQWQPLPTRRSSIRLQLTRLNRRHAHGLHHGRGHCCRRRQEGIASIVEYSLLSHTSNMAEGDR